MYLVDFLGKQNIETHHQTLECYPTDVENCPHKVPSDSMLRGTDFHEKLHASTCMETLRYVLGFLTRTKEENPDQIVQNLRRSNSYIIMIASSPLV